MPEVVHVVHDLGWFGWSALPFKAGMDKIVLVWCAQSGKNLGALRGHTQPVTCLCWQPLHVAEGDSFPLLATSSKDAAVRIWAPRNYRRSVYFQVSYLYYTHIYIYTLKS